MTSISFRQKLLTFSKAARMPNRSISLDPPPSADSTAKDIWSAVMDNAILNSAAYREQDAQKAIERGWLDYLKVRDRAERDVYRSIKMQMIKGLAQYWAGEAAEESSLYR